MKNQLTAEIECGPACPECSGALIQIGKDGEMELKEQYERKIRYKEEFLLYEASEEEYIIGIAIENSLQSILN